MSNFAFTIWSAYSKSRFQQLQEKCGSFIRIRARWCTFWTLNAIYQRNTMLFFHSLCARLAAQLIKSNKRIQENRTYHMESIPKPRKIIQQIILFVCCRVCIFCCLSICCHQLTEIKRSMIWNYAIIMSRLVKGLKFYAGFWFQFQCHSTIMHKLSSHTLRTHSITIGQRKFVC